MKTMKITILMHITMLEPIMTRYQIVMTMLKRIIEIMMMRIKKIIIMEISTTIDMTKTIILKIAAVDTVLESTTR